MASPLSADCASYRHRIGFAHEATARRWANCYAPGGGKWAGIYLPRESSARRIGAIRARAGYKTSIFKDPRAAWEFFSKCGILRVDKLGSLSS